MNNLQEAVASVTQQLFELLKKHQLTISTAESCSGGTLTNLLTNISGSSDVINGGINTYSTASKIKLLNVDEELIRIHTVYSKEVAEAMATNARILFDTTLGISTTGHIEHEDKENRQGAFIAISNGTIIYSKWVTLPLTRIDNKLHLAKVIFEECINFIDKNYNN